MRKVLTNFERLSQLTELVGKLGNKISRLTEFSLLKQQFRFFCTVSVDSQSFGDGFLLDLFFWIPESQRKVLKKFESLSQPAELVGKPDKPVH